MNNKDMKIAGKEKKSMSSTPSMSSMPSMPSMSPKEKDIVQAAMKLFSQYGYTGTTTIAIAQEAKVSEKTLFKYFHTKQELYDKTVYPMLKMMIDEKVTGYTSKGQEGVYKLLRDLYKEKIGLVNQNPDTLKLSFHEFLMNRSFQSHLGEIWGTSYFPNILAQLPLAEEVRQKYSWELTGGLTRAMVSLLLAYAIDKNYIRPENDFDDEKEIDLMLYLLFNGINGFTDENWRKSHESCGTHGK